VACCSRAIDWPNACRETSGTLPRTRHLELAQERSGSDPGGAGHATGLKRLSRQQAGTSKSHRSCGAEPLASKRQAFGCNVRLIPITNSQRQV
jgi:hypothetical protein